MLYIEKQLQQLGFDDSKTKVYLSLLQLGQAKVYEIARRSDMTRPTTYDVLNKLVLDGLVSFMERRGVRYYSIEDPRAIERQVNEKQRLVTALLPQLLSLYQTSVVQPKIRFYEGVEGIKTVVGDTLTVHEKKLCSILSVIDMFSIPGKEWMLDYVDRRVRSGVTLRVIRSKPQEVKEYWPTSKAALRELRYTPAGMVFAMTTYVYDNKVAFISSKKENFGLIVESEEVSQTYKNLFEALWQVSVPG